MKSLTSYQSPSIDNQVHKNHGSMLLAQQQQMQSEQPQKDTY
jgi:hypothetical protein